MEKEDCDYYEPKFKNYRDKICKYFTGDRNKQSHIGKCRFHCSILVSKRLMEEGEILVRKHGALRRK